MKRLKVGIIGTGSIADCHIRSYLQRKDVEIAAICDSNLSRAEKKAEEYGIRSVYGSHEEMMRRNDIDAVSVLTWTNTHEPIAISALNAGKHVLCEKPPATSAAAAVRMHEAAVRNGRLLMYGFVRRFGQSERILKEFIDRGRLGHIYYAKAGYVRRCGSPGGWFANREIAGGGALIDLGVHMIDLCMYFLGDTRPVSAFGAIHTGMGAKANIRGIARYTASDFGSGTYDAEDSANAVIRFENGASLFIEAGWTMNIKQDARYLDLCGDRGGASLEPRLELYSEENDCLVDILPRLDDDSFNVSEAFAAELNHFIQCVLYGETCICPSGSGIAVMKVIDAIYQSAKSGESVRLS